MINIQSTEAKARFSELLRTVERGETVAISRRGQTIAHVIPAPEAQRFDYKKAVEELRKIHEKWGSSELSIEDIVALKHAGHNR